MRYLKAFQYLCHLEFALPIAFTNMLETNLSYDLEGTRAMLNVWFRVLISS
jgi:hypothetical protein